MSFSNITDESFWNDKYKGKRCKYYWFDPIYGSNGLLNKTLSSLLINKESVLELGCGSSRFLMYFNMVEKMKTYGIDFSKEGLSNLYQMALSHNIKHTLYSGDMFENDIDKQKFDVVFHSGLVEHFSDLDHFFERCSFFCKKDGLMIFFMPNMQNKAWSWHKKICPVNYKSHILYNQKQIVSSFSPYFSFLEVRPWGYPQLYAGGPPESFIAKVAKYSYLTLIFFISLFFRGYRGRVGEKWASSWLFVCKPLERKGC